MGDDEHGGAICERQREHPFIVTEPGEVARGKKNGLDYLFHLYEQCRDFLIQVQNIAKERGEKCPTKVTNQVFRYAKKAGASYINKPKMRHYVHCYALHCLDEDASNALRRAFKERGENVGCMATGLLQAPCSHRLTPRLGHRLHFQRSSSACHLVCAHQASSTLLCRAQRCHGVQFCLRYRSSPAVLMSSYAKINTPICITLSKCMLKPGQDKVFVDGEWFITSHILTIYIYHGA
ncbi:hypothetical protein OIU84_007299 [Salix udensis]|uniref:Floricaula/leafy-like transcription factor n=1 Tax=Salix udensis TaxID=889485 RepID=A0AAD6JUM3_9ROSI|nr:hypothetical protein OIU84_007299 [Salix udensis]